MFKKIAFGLALVATVSSCKKDEETKPSTPKDLCAGITCKNGGTCVNGLCDCPDGYSGPDCSNQVTPSKIRISKIDVSDFLLYNPATGGGWDATDGPDLQIEILKGTSVIYTSGIFYDASQGTYSFVPTNPVEITDMSANYSVILYDHNNVLSDTYMGGVQFPIYSSTGGFPTTPVLTCSECDVKVKLTMSYSW